MPFISSQFFHRDAAEGRPRAPGPADELDESGQPDMRPNARRIRSTAVARPEPDPLYGPDDEIVEERGIVKFFDPAKGFGFAISTETGEDVFLPGSALKAKGLATVAPGSLLVFEAEDTDAAPRILEIVSIDQTTATAPAIDPTVPSTPSRPVSEPTFRSKGVVESWKTDKGFGFVRAENGDNVFVHVSVCGGAPPAPGSRVVIDYGSKAKGFVATGVSAA